MQRASAAISVLVVALLLGGWSNVIAACFCPLIKHSRHAEHSHPPAGQQELSCQHEMPEIKMDRMKMAGVEITPGNVDDCSVLETLNEQCCFMHSQSPPGTVTVVAVDPGRGLIEADAAPVNSAVALPSRFPIPINPSEHGPPGILFPRHLLISVFRI